MKDLRVYLPVLLLIIVLLLAGCKGFVPSPGTTDEDVTAITGQIKMPLICCDTLSLSEEPNSISRETTCDDESSDWFETPGAIVELKSANKGQCNKVLDTTIADDSGYYLFTDVKPGLYIITAYCPVEDDEGFLLKDVAEKLSGQALDAGIPDCTSTALALVIEKINNCYNDWYQCFGRLSAPKIYNTVETIASDIAKVDIEEIKKHPDFGNVCDDEVYGLVDMICEWSCCIGAGATGGGGGGGNTPSISLEKQVEPECYIPGETEILTYSFTVTNTGNVALSNVTLTDDMLGLDENIGTLTGGNSWNSGDYVIDIDDIDEIYFDDDESIINEATVTGNIGATTVSDTDSVTVEVCADECPELDETLDITVDITDPCDYECVTVDPILVKDSEGNTLFTLEPDYSGYTELSWTSDDVDNNNISFDPVTGEICLDEGDVETDYTISFSYDYECGGETQTATGSVTVNFEDCCPELDETLDITVDITDPCDYECVTVDPILVKDSEGNTLFTLEPDYSGYTELSWTSDDVDNNNISFDPVTGEICLDEGDVETDYTISFSYDYECGGETQTATGSVTVNFEDCCPDPVLDLLEFRIQRPSDGSSFSNWTEMFGFEYSSGEYNPVFDSETYEYNIETGDTSGKPKFGFRVYSCDTLVLEYNWYRGDRCGASWLEDDSSGENPPGWITITEGEVYPESNSENSLCNHGGNILLIKVTTQSGNEEIYEINVNRISS